MTVLDNRSNPCREARFATPPLTKPPITTLNNPPVSTLTQKPAPTPEPAAPPLIFPKMIVPLQGGLGNQLFGYAFGISVAAARHEDVGFTIWRCKNRERAYHLDALVDDIKLVPKNGETQSIFTDQKFFGFQSEVYTVPPSTFLGYWQTEKYFDINLVRQKIVFRYPLSDQSLRIAEAIATAGPTSTFLHIRRADYLTPAHQSHGTMPVAYYDEAIKQIRENYEGAKFFVFGDDFDWMHKQFSGKEFIVVDHIKPYSNSIHEDMRLMSLCRNSVIANSSFSWWGAWLGDLQPNRLVFAPNRWFANTVDSKDIVPDRWTKLKCDS